MPSVAADATDDVGGEVAGLRTVVLAVTDFAAVLAGLVLVVAEGAVEGCELAELVALEFVLAFGDGGRLCGSYVSSDDDDDDDARVVGWTHRLDHVVDQLLGLVDLLFRIGHDQAVQIFVLVAGVRRVRFAFPFLDRALAADGDLGLGLGLHLLQSVAARSDEEADC